MTRKPKRITFRVWSDLEGAKTAARRTASTALAAVMAHATRVVNDFGVGALPDDFIARPNKRGGHAQRFRVTIDPTGGGIGIDALRTCRKCACSDDRACDPPCMWIAPNLCSACG